MKKWTSGVESYVILAILIVYILVFLVLCALAYKRPDSNVSFKAYGKAIKIFKALANVAFLVLAAITMAAMVRDHSLVNLTQWAVFIGNLLVATVKLVIKVISLIHFIIDRHIAKHYSVQVTRYIDGEEQHKTFADKRLENKFK